MRRGVILLMLITIVLLLCIIVVLYITHSRTKDTITIANWNLQVFGDSKATNATLMGIYIEKIKHYDIVVVQEIRDADGSSWKTLCASLHNYSCIISERAGRSSSKEQYGVAFRNNITLIEMNDYTATHQALFERPPLRATFAVNTYNVTLYTIHIRPDSASAELQELEHLITVEGRDSQNIVVLGDLNADCAYYNEQRDAAFIGWTWAISDTQDTTAGKSDCTYDRILLNEEAKEEYITSGVDKTYITSAVSDHYLVWIKTTLAEGSGRLKNILH